MHAPRTLLTAGVVGAALALSACTGAPDDAARTEARSAPGASSAQPTLDPEVLGGVTPSPGEPLPEPTLSPGESPATVPTQATTKPLAELAETDLGQYLARPDGASAAEVDAAVGRLRAMPGVQSAGVNSEGLVDLVFLASSTPQQRAAALQELARLGEVVEGV
ncbi:MAG: hypothetical protein M3P93_01510 [Actinomycetota bacterium]|nr:hypothetical protein [Actinomycetota bacterium]MDP9460964.1 hypothetical protein [Actinomycetota bacterium]